MSPPLRTWSRTQAPARVRLWRRALRRHPRRLVVFLVVLVNLCWYLPEYWSWDLAEPRRAPRTSWTVEVPVESDAEWAALELVDAISQFEHFRRPTPPRKWASLSRERELVLSRERELVSPEEHFVAWEHLLPLPREIPATDGEGHPFLTLVAIASHESRFLVEWLTYHRLSGVTHFILLDIVPGGDNGGDGGDANVAGESLAELLKPWREEGSVILVQVSWGGNVVPPQWHQLVLAYLETYVVPRTAWIAHWDVDEFLLPPTRSLYKIGYSKIPTVTAHDHNTTPRWTFPAQRQFRSFPRCVPITRLEYLPEDEEEYEYGDTGTLEWQTVTGTHVWRNPTEAQTQRGVGATTLQQALLHPFYSPWTSSWMSGCNNNSQFFPLHSEGSLPLEDEQARSESQDDAEDGGGITLVRYPRRSHQHCLSKLAFPDELRGDTSCDAPADSDAALRMVEDRDVADSWEGRMTREILKRWREPEGWAWLERGSDPRKQEGPGIVRVRL